MQVAGHSLLLNDGAISGSYSWSEEELDLLKSELHNVSSTSILTIGSTRVVVDPISKTKTLYCFGAGHVAVPRRMSPHWRVSEWSWLTIERSLQTWNDSRRRQI